jgi:hypothetical protein
MLHGNSHASVSFHIVLNSIHYEVYVQRTDPPLCLYELLENNLENSCKSTRTGM